VAPLLDVRNLSIRFPRQAPIQQPTFGRAGVPDPHAVRDLSFAIAPGEVLGLVGESGSGKSVTSLAVMAFMSSGHVPGEGRYGKVVDTGIKPSGASL
jgi:ABC-type glutathione transport system ATPase component